LFLSTKEIIYERRKWYMRIKWKYSEGERNMAENLYVGTDVAMHGSV
jgi:hypothetical protein